MNLHYPTEYDPAVAAEILQTCKDVLTKVGVKFWLSDGGLLGLIRDGDVIATDHDWDIGVMTDEKLPEIRAKMPYREYASEKLYDHFQGFAWIYNKWILDLRFWWKVDNWLINAQGFPEENGIWQTGTFYEDACLFEKLGEINYKGVKFPIPEPVEKYLEVRYDNWKQATSENRWWLYTASFKPNKNEIWSRL